MSYHGDIKLGSTINLKFTTRQFSTGAPFTLAGTPAVSAYVGSSLTQITAGVTLTVDFDSVTGLNNVTVVASSGNGFAIGDAVTLVITAGTVDAVSVVGEVIGSFSIEARVQWDLTRTDHATTGTFGEVLDEAGIRTAVGLASANLDTQLSTIDTNVDAILVDTTAIEVDTQDIQSRLPAALSAGGNMKADVKEMNDTTVAGTGTALDKWRGA